MAILETFSTCMQSTDWSGVSIAALMLAVSLLPLSLWLVAFQRFPGRTALFMANLGMLWWLFFAAFELSVDMLGCKLFFGGLIHTGITLVPTAWLIFLIAHKQGQPPFTRPVRLFLYLVVPAAVSALALTSPAHGLFYGPDTRLVDGEVLHDRGIGFVAAAAYLYFFLIWALFILVRAYREGARYQRPQVVLLLAVTGIPIVGNLAYTLGGFSLAGYDPTPFLFAVAVGAYVIMLLGGGALNVSAIARRQVIDTLPQAIFVVTREDEIIPSNAAAMRMLAEEVDHRGDESDPEIVEDLIARFHACRDTEGRRLASEAFGLRYYDFSVDPVRPVFGPVHEPLGWLFSAQDVSVSRARERALERIARRTETARRQAETSAQLDPLTGLLNRRALGRRFDVMAASGQPLAAAVLDVDHFKAINDLHGHDLGDLVLVNLSRALRARFREADAVFRLGGEEFLVLVAGAEEQSLLLRLADVRNVVGRAVDVHNLTVPAIGFSAGIARLPDDGTDFEALYRAADSRLLTAKSDGRDRVVTAARSMVWSAVGAPPDGPQGPR
ncbi:histidine kinase N-terminal 7TM domain-containing protein [Citreimonas sp.]|uniref:GGDEF domain-containing protein n=1 Tax=Citreimonas sp. TaxID=3036715 RepID=UPI0035C8647B